MLEVQRRGSEGSAIRPAGPHDEEAVVRLLRDAGLEAEFVASQFTVVALEGGVVACARMKPLDDGSHEIASVAVAPGLRGRGIGEALVTRVLAGRAGPVHALALAPGFFARLGFEPVAAAHPLLAAKAASACASRAFTPMVWTGLAPAR